MSDDDLMPLILLGKILFWVLIWYLFWGRKGRTEEPPEPVSSSANGTMERLGRSLGKTDLPIIGPILKERKRREEEARRKKAEAEARERAERDRAQKEHDALIERPIPRTSTGYARLSGRFLRRRRPLSLGLCRIQGWKNTWPCEP
jgi:hypothetical protein